MEQCLVHDQAVVGNPICRCEDTLVTSMDKDRNHGFGRRLAFAHA